MGTLDTFVLKQMAKDNRFGWASAVAGLHLLGRQMRALVWECVDVTGMEECVKGPPDSA